MIFYLSLLAVWVFSIGKIINSKSTNIYKLKNYNENLWLKCYLMAIVGLLLSWNFNISYGVLKLILFSLGLFSGFKLTNFSSKVLKQYEMKSELPFKKYALEFFLIIYMIIGVWFLQPRLNKIMKEE